MEEEEEEEDEGKRRRLVSQLATTGRAVCVLNWELLAAPEHLLRSAR